MALTSSEFVLVDQDLLETLWEALSRLEPDARLDWLEERFPEWREQFEVWAGRGGATRLQPGDDSDLYAICGALAMEPDLRFPVAGSLTCDADALGAWLEVHGAEDEVIELLDDLADGHLKAVRTPDFLSPGVRSPYLRNVIPSDRIESLRDAFRHVGDGDRVSRSSSMEIPLMEIDGVVSGLNKVGYDDSRLAALWDETRALMLVALERALERGLALGEVVR